MRDRELLGCHAIPGPDQMEFKCGGFRTGTSGGPWIIGYNAKTGTGTVFGVIGGYQEGGDSPLVSYSSYFTSPARILFGQAEKAPVPTPSPSPSPSLTHTATPTTPAASPAGT